MALTLIFFGSFGAWSRFARLQFLGIRNAISKKDDSAIKKYLDEHGDPNGKFDSAFGNRKSNTSLLHHSINESNLYSCEILLAYGADPNITDFRGRTPLMLLFDKNPPAKLKSKFLAMLLPVTNLEAVDENRKNVLHHAAEYGSKVDYKNITEMRPSLSYEKDSLGQLPSDIFGKRFSN